MDPTNDNLSDEPLPPGGNQRGTSDVDEPASDTDSLNVAAACSCDDCIEAAEEPVFSVMCAYGNGPTAGSRNQKRKHAKYMKDLDLKSSPAILLALHDTSHDTITFLRSEGWKGDPGSAAQLRRQSWRGLDEASWRARDREFSAACPAHEFLVERGDEPGRTNAIAGRSSFCESLTTLLWEIRTENDLGHVEPVYVTDTPLNPLQSPDMLSRIQIVRVRFKKPVCGMRECVLANVAYHFHTMAEEPQLCIVCVFSLCAHAFMVARFLVKHLVIVSLYDNLFNDQHLNEFPRAE